MLRQELRLTKDDFQMIVRRVLGDDMIVLQVSSASHRQPVRTAALCLLLHDPIYDALHDPISDTLPSRFCRALWQLSSSNGDEQECASGVQRKAATYGAALWEHQSRTYARVCEAPGSAPR